MCVSGSKLHHKAGRHLAFDAPENISTHISGRRYAGGNSQEFESWDKSGGLLFLLGNNQFLYATSLTCDWIGADKLPFSSEYNV